MFGFLDRPLRLLVGLTTLLVLLLVAPPPLAAQNGGITLQVEPFFSGHYKYGEWLPLRISIVNGGAPVSADVRVEMTATGGQTAWLVPVELPTSAQKQITLYVLPTSFAQVARVRVLNGAQELAHENALLIQHPSTDYLIGVVASRPEGLSASNVLNLDGTIARTTHTLTMGLRDLPARVEGLGALDALVVSDVDTSALSPDQKRALTAWVEQGGRLIVGGGASAARTLAGLPDALIADLRAQNNVMELNALTALDAFGEAQVRVPGPFAAAFAASSAAGGAAVIQQGEGALVTEKRVGGGYVTYSALDLSASPFDAWAGAGTFWKKILSPGSAYPLNTPKDISPAFTRTREMAAVLDNLPALALPSLDVLTGLLAAYIILVGPVNYIVLRRLKKLDWGWLSIPALTCLFAIGAFGISNQLRGSDVILNQVSVVEFSPMGTARQVETLVGLFSPTRGTFNLEAPEDAFVIPVSAQYNPYDSSNNNGAPVEIVESNPVVVRGVNLNQGALQGFAIRSPAPADWSFESDLTLAGDRVRGKIVSRLNAVLSNVILVSGEHYLYLDQLKPQEPREVDQAWYAYGGNIGSLPIGTTPTTQALRQIIAVEFNALASAGTMPRTPYLLGWLETSPLDVRVQNVNASRQTKTLVVVPLSLKYAPGVIHLLGRDWRVEQAPSSGERINCGTPNLVGVRNGSVELNFMPPLAVRVTRVKMLKVLTKNAYGQTLDLQLLGGEWKRIDQKAGDLELEAPEQYVSPSGEVRMRIATTDTSERCYEYGLEMEAETAQ